jgi:uncharacterized membrane protein
MIEIIPNWHPIFVHFSIALLGLSVALFVISKMFADTDFGEHAQIAAVWNLWIGTLLSVGTVAAGLVAYNTVDHDTASHLAMTDHRNWAIPTFLLFLGLSGWMAWFADRRQAPSSAFLVVALVAAMALAATGYKGGELVYRHGLGVMSLPDAGSHDHATGGHHDHGAAAGHDAGDGHHDISHGHHDDIGGGQAETSHDSLDAAEPEVVEDSAATAEQ